MIGSDVLDVAGEPFVQPTRLVPLIHRHEIAKPLVRQFMSDENCYILFVLGRGKLVVM